MKKQLSGLFIVIFLAGFLLPGVAVAADRGISINTKSGKKIPLYSKSYALVVGNGNYTNGWDPLPGALRDAGEVAEALEKQGFNVTLKKDLNRREFARAFSEFAIRDGRDADSRLLFYYAGHGHTTTLKNSEELGYLVMVDSPVPEKDPIGFDTRNIDMQFMVTQAKKTNARHVLFMFDSCFSGTILNLRDRPAPAALSDNVKYPVRQFITAGRANESVPDYSVFKECFLKLISGRDREPIEDGYITGEELGLYLKNKVPTYNSGQHPQFGKISDPKLDDGDFIFLAGGSFEVDEPVNDSGSGVQTSEGYLSVRCEVSGSVVYVDNVRVGTAPVRAKSLKPGNHRLSVKAPGYETYTKNITVRAGRSLSLDVILDREKPKMASLYVDTDPKEARVRILNINPVYSNGMELDPGQYHIEVSANGYESEKQWVELKAGEDKWLTINLDKKEVAETSFTNSLGMKFVYIPPGSFMMGSPSNESGRDSDEKQHEVTLTEGFYMQTTEVTVGQWREFVRSTGFKTDGEKQGWSWAYNGSKWEKKKGAYWDNPGFSQNANQPVTCISWNDVQAFVRWLSQKDGTNYSLPTEAEWEYACRAGSTSRFCFGSRDNKLGQYAWYGDNFSGKTHPVASKKPNAWGLYDMHGNVWEWCQDWYGDYPSGSVTNPTGPSSGTYRVGRGGGWNGTARNCRSGIRYRFRPGDRDADLGFRLAFVLVR